MKIQPSVTACLTVHNAQAFIENTIDSIGRQTYTNLQILVSDDCSSDHTRALLEKFIQSRSDKWTYYRQDRRLGWVDNTNFLLNKINTELFFLCYHDDTLEPTYVEKLVSAIPDNPLVVGAFCDIELTLLSGQKTLKFYDADEGAQDPIQRALKIIRMRGTPWVANRGVFRSTALKQVGGLRRHLAGDSSAAYPWLLGLALKGKLVRVPEVLCHKTLHPTGVSSGWKKTYRETLALYIDLYETVWRSSLDDEKKDLLMLELSNICKKLLEDHVGTARSDGKLTGEANHRATNLLGRR